MADYIDLYTLQTTVRNDIGSLYPDSVWVKAEIASLSVKSNGHCYMEFSQTRGGVLVAKARAVAWRNRYLLMDSAFASVTGSRLAAGMEILALVRISYHEIYGFSLTVEDVNPEFTLGQREKLRKETLARLTGEGLAELQKNLTLSHIPYRLAVISAETAAGWGDFSRHIRENARGYAYDLRLFPAQMQGQDAPVSMMAALASVLASGERYDAVLILRGGGSGLDLDCFDDYGLCAAVARCPLPVLSAVGHDRDVHVLDMVAYAALKTPTALADFILDTTASAEAGIDALENRLNIAFAARFSALQAKMDLLFSRICQLASSAVDRAETSLRLLEMRLDSGDPRQVIRRGYTLVLDKDSVRLSSASSSVAGDTVRVVFPDGILNCRVESVGTMPYFDENKEEDGKV